ncbi:MAG: hypothetical protein U9Q58_09900 [Pseudomonadota bacterium]|nr:hypothetical protein [Pseudomonadota bacterium]
MGFALPYSNTIFLVDDNDELHDIGEGLIPWASDVREPFEKTLFSGISKTELPAGNYQAYLLAVPGGDDSLENSGFYDHSFDVPTVVCDGLMTDGLMEQISKSFTCNITPTYRRHLTGSERVFFYESPFHIDGDY